MKITNFEILQISKCIQEILDCKEAKEATDSAKVTYAMVKTFNEMTPLLKELSQKELDLRDAAKKATTPESKEEIDAQFNKDMTEFMNANAPDVRFHKITMKDFDILQKYLSGTSVLYLYNFLTITTDVRLAEAASR